MNRKKEIEELKKRVNTLFEIVTKICPHKENDLIVAGCAYDGSIYNELYYNLKCKTCDKERYISNDKAKEYKISEKEKGIKQLQKELKELNASNND